MKTRNDGISWTHDTQNFWLGCDKVSDECKYCYIYRQLRRLGLKAWGDVVKAKSTWTKADEWEKELSNTMSVGNGRRHCNTCGTFSNGTFCEKCGDKPYMRMFTCSLSDFFHAKSDKWRPEAWEKIKSAPHCVFLILTKRPERILRHLPKDWGENGYQNVWLGTSIGSNKTTYRVDVLRKVPAAVRFLSCEPLLEDIADNLDLTGIQWVIAGGESGEGKEYLYDPTKRWQDGPETGRRTMKLEWAYKLYVKANDAGIPFFFKQITSGRSGVGADKLTGKVIHEFPAPPNGGVWWTPPAEESVQPPAEELVQITGGIA
jgi:protein gp37